MPHNANLTTPAPASSATAAPTGDARRSIRFNGEAMQTAAPTLQALLDARGLDPTRQVFVCAVNGTFVPRTRWAGQVLAADDRVDIIAPVVGG
ncbi:MAG: sulfur carrier protein ThiS [Betaproteobacteria bacterium]|nr:sulfur carrier protein ThiS [Betaproteobacteria bacterium]MDE2124575.1 sulfur carrier protein ThiS [Betaproteobacteria bacterium]MDE2187426.1 sulfur carrier protein ThiS [Betaproteobacteria bacterium]